MIQFNTEKLSVFIGVIGGNNISTSPGEIFQGSKSRYFKGFRGTYFNIPPAIAFQKFPNLCYTTSELQEDGSAHGVPCVRKVRTPQGNVAGNARLRVAMRGRIRATETNAGQCPAFGGIGRSEKR